MIYLYTGTPGSGKSYHATIDVYNKLNRKKKNFEHRVISNYYLNVESDNFYLLDNSEITTEYLYNFARKYHKPRIEAQTLLIVDEAQILFNSRDWQSNNKISGTKVDTRMDWIKFFSQHRKFGYTVIMIAQNDRMIDRQIRSLVEYEVAHMKMNNYFRIIPITMFMAVTRWYGQKMKLSHEMFIYRKKMANLYDSYAFFDNEDENINDENDDVKAPAQAQGAEREGCGVPSLATCEKQAPELKQLQPYYFNLYQYFINRKNKKGIGAGVEQSGTDAPREKTKKVG